MPRPEPLFLFSLNIEGTKHLDAIFAFLEREKPDVFCVQELFESDIPLFARFFRQKPAFAPMTIYGKGGLHALGEKGLGSPDVMGVGVFTDLPVVKKKIEYYYRSGETLKEHIAGDEETIDRALVTVELKKGGESFRIATTHFTRTKDGIPDGRQRRDLKPLMELLGRLGDFVLAGDFNAMRGEEVFDTIAARYRDNIPQEYKSSLDPKLHRVGHLDLMVDGLFTTPGYVAEGTRLVERLSDHKAIVSRIRRT